MEMDPKSIVLLTGIAATIAVGVLALNSNENRYAAAFVCSFAGVLLSL